MSTHNTIEPVAKELKPLEKSLLEIADVTRVIRLEKFEVDTGAVLVATKLSLLPELTMQQVSIVVALAERRIRSLVPEAKHVYVTPDVYIDQKDVPSTSTIVTLSYD